MTMQVTKKNLTDTKVQLLLIADTGQLQTAKQETLREFARTTKVQGFREGKAPLSMVEKHADPARLQSEFAERAINLIYVAALEQEKLRPVQQPDIKITKFVPFDTLEITAEVEIVGDVTLPDYKKIKLARDKVAVTVKEIDEVIANLRTREAARKDVQRAAKTGDQITFDFTGVDAKTKEPIQGADGKDFPLVIGSNTFIPGFEPNLVGLKAGDTKTFVVTFPKDYGVNTLQNRKVEFGVTAKSVQEIAEPELDDEFAAKVGPFKTVADLKADIKQELQTRKQSEADQKYADDLLTKITEKSKVVIPELLITEQLDRLEQEQRQNLTYRGQTWQEFLDSEGITAEAYREKQKPAAKLRVKVGLVLATVSELEEIDVSDEDVDAYMMQLAARYPDQQMQTELAKPEARSNIASRLRTEKTIAKLTAYAAS